MKGWMVCLGALLFLACNTKPVEGPRAPKAESPPAAPAAPAMPPEEAAPGPPEAPILPTITEVADVGFATPESVLYDADGDVYLVSNINGSPLAVDDNGFISRVSPDGKVQDLAWIDGAVAGVTLNAPKGMAIQGGVLYVADLDHVRKFDAVTGRAKGSISIEGSTFLNDMVAGSAGVVYVSDSGLTTGFEPSGTDAVYRIDAAGRVTEIAKDASLGRPNGLVFDGDVLRVVSFGSGEVYSLDVDGKQQDAVQTEEGSLDGVIRAPDGELVISSWKASGLYKGPPIGPFVLIATELDAPADIGYDSKRKRVLVPLFNLDALKILDFSASW